MHSPSLHMAMGSSGLADALAEGPDGWYWRPRRERPPPGPHVYEWEDRDGYQGWRCLACVNSSGVARWADSSHVDSDPLRKRDVLVASMRRQGLEVIITPDYRENMQAGVGLWNWCGGKRNMRARGRVLCCVNKSPV